jgi:hypothetical protein
VEIIWREWEPHPDDPIYTQGVLRFSPHLATQVGAIQRRYASNTARSTIITP